MGCYPPLAKFVSKALGKCNGRERWRERRLDMDFAMAYPPGPPMQTHYMQPVARTVTFASNNNVFVIPPPQQKKEQEQEQEQSTPEPAQQQPPEPETPPPQQAEADHHDTPPPQPPHQPEHQQSEQEKASDHAAPAPPGEPKPPKAPKRGKNKKPGGRVRFGPEPPPPQEQEQEQHDHEEQHAPGHHHQTEGQQHQQENGRRPVPPYLLYTPSPLPRWEATPRRHEYFSGEYRSYYPTPVREGIYRIATDANRLTTIFSEENPNACAIV